MTEDLDFKNMWNDKPGDGDALDYVGAKPAAPVKARKLKQNYLHANMEEIVVGVPATGIVWLRLLQLKAMRPRDKHHDLANVWLEQHGVDRYAKMRALQVLEKRGLIRVVRLARRSPQVYIIPRSKRRVHSPQKAVADS
jgi:hypothetical protein